MRNIIVCLLMAVITVRGIAATPLNINGNFELLTPEGTPSGFCCVQTKR